MTIPRPAITELNSTWEKFFEGESPNLVFWTVLWLPADCKQMKIQTWSLSNNMKTSLYSDTWDSISLCSFYRGDVLKILLCKTSLTRSIKTSRSTLSGPPPDLLGFLLTHFTVVLPLWSLSPGFSLVCKERELMSSVAETGRRKERSSIEIFCEQ